MKVELNIPMGMKPIAYIDNYSAYTVSQWAKIIEYNSTTHTKLDRHDVYELFAKFGIQKYDYYRNNRIKLFRFYDVQNKIYTNYSFMCKFFGIRPKSAQNKKPIDPSVWIPKADKNGYTYYDGGPDMEQCSEFLAHQNNFESICRNKSIIVKECQLNKLLNTR